MHYDASSHLRKLISRLKKRVKEVFSFFTSILLTGQYSECSVPLALLSREHSTWLKKQLSHLTATFSSESTKHDLHHLLMVLDHLKRDQKDDWLSFPTEINFGSRNLNVQNTCFPDVHLVVDEREIPCHKCFLVGNSEYFKVMLTSAMKESTDAKIEMHEIDFDTLKKLVLSCYEKPIVVSNEVELFQLLVAAQQYQMTQLSEKCLKLLPRVKIGHDTEDVPWFLGNYDFLRPGGSDAVLTWIVRNWAWFGGKFKLLQPHLEHFRTFFGN